MSTSYQPDDFDILVWTDKLRERVAFRNRIARQRPSLWAEIKAVDVTYVAIHLVILAGFLSVLAMLISVPA